MKDQYFGDERDYFKYGLLRALAVGGLRLGVCWMLTPPEPGRDGRHTEYLEDPDAWRRQDPELYAGLRRAVRERDTRRVREAEGFLGDAHFHADPVPESAPGRGAWLAGMLGQLAGADLIFFDPDNGLEIPSQPFHPAPSAKHLYWSELRTTLASGASALVFQYIPHEAHEPYIARRLGELRARTGAAATGAFVTSQVVFLLAARAPHVDALRAGAEEVRRRWGRRDPRRGHGWIDVRFRAGE